MLNDEIKKIKIFKKNPQKNEGSKCKKALDILLFITIFQIPRLFRTFPLRFSVH